jgi:hypothetical protein
VGGSHGRPLGCDGLDLGGCLRAAAAFDVATAPAVAQQLAAEEGVLAIRDRIRRRQAP